MASVLSRLPKIVAQATKPVSVPIVLRRYTVVPEGHTDYPCRAILGEFTDEDGGPAKATFYLIADTCPVEPVDHTDSIVFRATEYRVTTLAFTPDTGLFELHGQCEG